MPRASEQLASRFRRAMLYVIEALGEVPTTKLQKILYLADLEHFLGTGTMLTGARWVRYTHGPMAKALLPSTAVMDGHEIAVALEAAGPYEARIYRPGLAPRFRPNLASEERAALDKVLTLTRNVSTSEAIALAYNTAPMRALLRLEQGRQPLLDVEIPFDIDDQMVGEAASPLAIEPLDSAYVGLLGVSEHIADYGGPTPEDRAAFKSRELQRVADLAEAARSQ